MGFTGLLIILAIPSLRKKIFNGNGDGDKKMQNDLTLIKDNHLHEIKDGNDQILAILKEFKEYGIKIRRQ